MNPGKIVYCTTCKGRVQHLSQTLPRNLADNPDAKFVVLDYNDGDGLARYLKTKHGDDIKSGRVVVYQHQDPIPFRMAHAKNMAHRLGILEGGDILVNLDSDNFTGAGFSEYVQQHFSSTPNAFLWSQMIKGAGMPRGISGRIAVSRDDFILAGGYDEKYTTHSPDDKDFKARLSRMGLSGLEVDTVYLQAINHTDRLRYREYPEAAGATYEQFVIQHKYVVVNAGNIGCGRVYRNFERQPITLAPIPTRIFGIGLQKTATTSLHSALQTLGYKSAHWNTAHWAKAVWKEMNDAGRSSTLERVYAASDLPIPLLYQKLDRAYPGSKFILTTRDEVNWLLSMRNHWSFDHNKFRHQWEDDAFSHRVHTLMYGRHDFEPITFLQRFRSYHAEVMEYFRGRSQDLLVMNMDNGYGWPELCSFLNAPIPATPYPSISPTKP